MADLNSVVSRSPSVVTRKTGNEYVLVPLTDNIADMTSVYTLNETGTFIWELIDGEKNVGDIINALIREYDTDSDTAKEDVLSFISKMKKYLVVK
ncbi:MAG: PqqD family protein [Bacteroidetes bacterium]|jgi:hypothetical protein|nr:PqqD family protein [Bacteroidota bacterium]